MGLSRLVIVGRKLNRQRGSAGFSGLFIVDRADCYSTVDELNKV